MYTPDQSTPPPQEQQHAPLPPVIPAADLPFTRVNGLAPRQPARSSAGPQFTRPARRPVEATAPADKNVESAQREAIAAAAGQVAAEGATGGEYPPQDPPPKSTPPAETPPPGAPETAGSGGDDGGQKPPDLPVPSPNPEELPQEPEDQPPVRLRLPPLRAIRQADNTRAAQMAKDMARIEEERAKEREHFWPVSNSKLDQGKDSYEDWFKEVLPSDEGLREHIETTLQDVTPRLGIELGGVGSGLFDGFSEGFFDASVGVSLTDLRQVDFDRFETLLRDDHNNHAVIEGNILQPETIRRVDEWRGDQKFALIVRRMFRGDASLPTDPYALAVDAGVWYERAAEGALLLDQTPEGLVPYMDKWKILVNRAAPELDVQVGKYEGYGLVRIHKRPGSPEKLPVISARAMMEERNAMRRFRRRP